ncbi:hypothetical protein [Streptomyces sp. NPDC005322]
MSGMSAHSCCTAWKAADRAAELGTLPGVADRHLDRAQGAVAPVAG